MAYLTAISTQNPGNNEKYTVLIAFSTKRQPLGPEIVLKRYTFHIENAEIKYFTYK